MGKFCWRLPVRSWRGVDCSIQVATDLADIFWRIEYVKSTTNEVGKFVRWPDGMPGVRQQALSQGQARQQRRILSWLMAMRA